MSFYWLRRKRREHAVHLLKFVYLSDDEVWYRSFSENLGLRARSSALADIYQPLSQEVDRYRKSLRTYFIVLAAGLMVSVGMVTDIDYSGIKFSQASLSLFILVTLGFANFLVGWEIVKVRAGQSIFAKVWQRSNAADRSYLMLHYPNAYGAHLYYVSPNLHSSQLTSTGNFPKLIAFVVLSFSAAILLFLLPIYVFYTLGLEVWTAPDSTIVSKGVVTASIAAALGAWILPTGSFFKTRYQHNGLVQLLNRAMNEDEDRYMRAVARIHAVETANENSSKESS